MPDTITPQQVLDLALPQNDAGASKSLGEVGNDA